MKLILALTVVALASGCSSLPMQKAENVSVSPAVSCDYARMQTIDRVAQQRGVYVEWVHCPTIKRERT
jgi:hypothetical protein